MYAALLLTLLPLTFTLRVMLSRPLPLWLSACLLLVVAMVLLGGYTRLSGSGLSMTDWRPVTGWLPPLSTQQWHEAYDAYRDTPQYVKVNRGMTLEEFKGIFWPEYLHRLLGRLVGLTFFVPFLWFLARKQLSPPLIKRLLLIFILGGLQGFVGWIMVRSGLQDHPYVNHHKLAFHLGMAFIIAGLLLWTLLDLLKIPRLNTRFSARAIPQLVWIIGLLFIQILFGAKLAGLHGGMMYNTWPTMNGEWMPSDVWFHSPWWINLESHIPTIQFIHRWNAALVSVLIVGWGWIHRNALKGNIYYFTTCGILGLQFGLGILTLIYHVPFMLAWLHQFFGLVLFLSALALLHQLRHNKPEKSMEYSIA